MWCRGRRLPGFSDTGDDAFHIVARCAQQRAKHANAMESAKFNPCRHRHTPRDLSRAPLPGMPENTYSQPTKPDAPRLAHLPRGYKLISEN
jgi:hypothetical protein